VCTAASQTTIMANLPNDAAIITRSPACRGTSSPIFGLRLDVIDVGISTFVSTRHSDFSVCGGGRPPRTYRSAPGIEHHLGIEADSRGQGHGSLMDPIAPYRYPFESSTDGNGLLVPPMVRAWPRFRAPSLGSRGHLSLLAGLSWPAISRSSRRLDAK